MPFGPLNGSGEVGDARLSEEVRDTIDEIRLIFQHWNTEKVNDKMRRSFLMTLSEQADYLGVSLAVEHLLPGLIGIVQD